MTDIDRLIDELVRRLRGRPMLEVMTAARQIENRVRDGRVRYGHRFYGAHTGRWSGEGVQTQNLPRSAWKWGEDEVNVREPGARPVPERGFEKVRCRPS